MQSDIPSGRIRRRLRGFGLTLLLAAAALPARAEQLEFSISIRGLSAARLSVNGTADGGHYLASGVMKSSGLLGFLKKIRYDASVAGRLVSGRYTPEKYTEVADTGKRHSEAVMGYKAGVPQVKTYNPPRPPRPGDIDPATQGGTVDPLTALFAVLRTVPAAEACKLKLTLFDGRRRSQLVLSTPEAADDGIVCRGEYRRLQGFSAEEMAEKSRFPFTLIYRPAGDGLVRVEEVSMDTLYGKGRMIRR